MRPTFRMRMHKPPGEFAAMHSPAHPVGLMDAVERFIRNQLMRKRERTLRK